MNENRLKHDKKVATTKIVFAAVIAALFLCLAVSPVAAADSGDIEITGGIFPVAPYETVFAKESNNLSITGITNTGNETVSGITVNLYASDVSSTEIVGSTTIDQLDADESTDVYIIDPTIRKSQGTLNYIAVIGTDGNSSVSDEFAIKYNGYKGKGLYWGEGTDIEPSNITTKLTYDLNGGFLYYTQPSTTYVGGGWTSRTETWNATDLQIPDNATVIKALLYVSYNWDNTSGGYPSWDATLNGETIDITPGHPYRDQSNFGSYGERKYGLYSVDVTSQFNTSGNNFTLTSNEGNYQALYPSTLAVIYSDASATKKQIFINEECDVLLVNPTRYGTTEEESTAYAPFSGMSIDTDSVVNATLYSFVGSGDAGEGNLIFNDQTVATNAWQGDSKSSIPYVCDTIKDYLSTTENTAGIQATDSTMVASEQILVVEYEKVTYPDLTINSLTPNVGSSEVFSNSLNNYTAVVANIGDAPAGPFDVKFNVTGSDGSYTGTVHLSGLRIGATTSVTWTDTTIRDVGDEVNVMVTVDEESSLTESLEDNNNMSIEKTVANNGYRGKRWTGGKDLETVQTYGTLKGDLLTSVGDSYYLSATTYPDWTEYAVNWTSSDIQLPAGAEITSARLYVPYTWDKGPVFPYNVGLDFNGQSVDLAAYYEDSKMWGSYAYPSGAAVYDVSSFYNTGEINTATLIDNWPGGGNVSISGMLLAVVYNDVNASSHEIIINEGFDIIYGVEKYSVTAEQATAYVPFDGTITNVGGIESATLLTYGPNAVQTNDELIFNDATFDGPWIYAGNSQIGASSVDVTDYITSTGNMAEFRSDGNYMAAMAAFLVVKYPDTGSIKITSNEVADVFLDGADTGEETDTTLTDIPVGGHVITLVKENYPNYSRQVTVTADMTTEITFVLSQKTGTLSAASDPSGASIIIDGVDTGSTTNDTIAGIGIGSHTVTLTKTGYVSASEDFTISENATTDVEITLVENIGSINVTSDPSGATIYLDGVNEGTTNTILTGVAGGSHNVTVVKTDYTNESEVITVVAGQTNNVAFDLTTSPATIYADSYPEGARIYVDGCDTGEVTPAVLTVYPSISGSAYNITYVLNNYYDASDSVSASPGGSYTSSCNLERVSIDLEEGWNFVSTPKTLAEGSNTIAIFNSVNKSGNSVLAYDASTDEWIQMVPTDVFSTLDGIWIYSGENCSVPLTFAAADSPQTPPTKSLYEGWNAIGFSGTTTATAAEDLISVDDTWKIAIGFDASNQEYRLSILNAAGDRDRYMLPTYGYWLYMNNDGTLAAISG